MKEIKEKREEKGKKEEDYFTKRRELKMQLKQSGIDKKKLLEMQ